MKGLLRRTNQLVLVSSTAIAAAGTLVALLFLPVSYRGPLSVGMLLIPTHYSHACTSGSDAGDRPGRHRAVPEVSLSGPWWLLLRSRRWSCSATTP